MNARSAGIAMPEISKYKALKRIAPIAAIFFISYCKATKGNSAKTKRKIKNIKPAIAPICSPDTDKKCANPEFL